MSESQKERAAARSRLFQLLAWAFAYPIPELHAQMADGRFSRSLGEARLEAFGAAAELPACGRDFTAWEAEYVALFEVGRRGTPLAMLCAGDDPVLLDGKGRPEFLLELLRWYGHFGLGVCEEPETRELPDHLTCQLEFLAWLAHLESDADPEGELASGYRQAQYDFCTRCLQPFIARLAPTIEREATRGEYDGLFSALGAATLDAVRATVGSTCSVAVSAAEEVATMTQRGEVS